MATLDTQTLLHIGIEFVVIGGLTYWQHKNISAVRDEVAELKEKLAKMEEIIASQGQLLMQHEQFFRGVPQQPSMHRQPHVNKPIPEEPDVSNEELDKLLASELKTICEEEDEYSEVEECHGDSCPVDFKKKKKKEE